MSASSIFLTLFKSAPQMIRMSLDMSWLYLTLGWRVRATRRAFEKQLIKEGMSKNDAEHLSRCFEDLKNDLVSTVKQGLSFMPSSMIRNATSESTI
jgi:hypothetical protein